MHGSNKKAFGSILFGASVEYEMGLYTVVFLKAQKEFAGMQRWPAYPVRLGRDKLLIQCHAFAGNAMGSCYVK